MTDEQIQKAGELLRQAVTSPQRLTVLEASLEKEIRRVPDPRTRERMTEILDEVRENGLSAFGSGDIRRDLEELLGEETAPSTPRQPRRRSSISGRLSVGRRLG